MEIVKSIRDRVGRFRVRRARRQEYFRLSATVETVAGRENIDAFFAELKKITCQTDDMTHAFTDPNGDLIGHIQLQRAGGTVNIHRIWAAFPRRGAGSKMIRQICELADRHQVFVKLKVAPLGPKKYPMSAAELQEWYHRHGFRGETRLIRSPVT